MAGEGLTRRQRLLKRNLDLAVGVPLLVGFAPVIAVAWVLATLDTRRSGLFRQQRVGRDGELFEMMKIRTMRGVGGSSVTISGDARITRLGAVLRRLKIDELPQLVNVVRGQMSLVGPRPDVPGFADRLTGGDRVLLTVCPGITSPAAVAFRHEESMLAAVADPERWNRDVLWPEKVRINREYVENWTLRADVACLFGTLRSVVGARPDDSGTHVKGSPP